MKLKPVLHGALAASLAASVVVAPAQAAGTFGSSFRDNYGGVKFALPFGGGKNEEARFGFVADSKQANPTPWLTEKSDAALVQFDFDMGFNLKSAYMNGIDVKAMTDKLYADDSDSGGLLIPIILLVLITGGVTSAIIWGGDDGDSCDDYDDGKNDEAEMFTQNSFAFTGGSTLYSGTNAFGYDEDCDRPRPRDNVISNDDF